MDLNDCGAYLNKNFIEEKIMQNDSCIPYGSDVSAGTFRCVDCGRKITVSSVTSLPPCPNHEQATHPRQCWEAMSGYGDAQDDPQS